MNLKTSFRLQTTLAAFCGFAFFVLHCPVGLRAQNVIPSQEQAGIDKDIARHFGDAPANPGPKAGNLSASLDRKSVGRAIRIVGDWQLKQSKPYFDQIWTWSVMYAGYMAVADALPEPAYRDSMREMGDKFHWELRSELPNADD